MNKETVAVSIKILDRNADRVAITVEASPEALEEMFTVEAGNLIAEAFESAVAVKGKAN